MAKKTDKNENEKVFLQVYMNRAFKDALQDYASKRGFTMTAIMKLGLEEFIERHPVTE